MKALVLAGGLGTRLRPLTYTRPKHLLPIANVPHIERVFSLLLSHGIDEAVLLTSYLADAFSTAIERAAARGLRVETTFEREPLGTAGAFKNAEEFARTGTFIAFNGDILTEVDLTALVRWHRERGAEATIVLHEVDDPSAFGVVPTDDSGRVLGFVEKPARDEAVTNMINAGIYVFEPSVLERIPSGAVWSAERQLFPSLVEEGTLYARSDEGAYWLDIGTPEKYLEANLDALRGRFGDLDARDAVVAGPGSEIASDAVVRLACLGAGCSIGAGARVSESVLLDGASVGAGAVVTRSVLGAGAVVEAGARLADAAVGDDEAVSATAGGRRA